MHSRGPAPAQGHSDAVAAALQGHLCTLSVEPPTSSSLAELEQWQLVSSQQLGSLCAIRACQPVTEHLPGRGSDQEAGLRLQQKPLPGGGAGKELKHLAPKLEGRGGGTVVQWAAPAPGSLPGLEMRYGTWTKRDEADIRPAATSTCECDCHRGWDSSEYRSHIHQHANDSAHAVHPTSFPHSCPPPPCPLEQRPSALVPHPVPSTPQGALPIITRVPHPAPATATAIRLCCSGLNPKHVDLDSPASCLWQPRASHSSLMVAWLSVSVHASTSTPDTE
ncbi:hypothetical protein H920_03562 [Fukomys damarensis]|uniref:Uncharacterized protein n=1 Tax=Fukomys damarensis TaxID=885580 RepID=A0A091DXL5_FUKDA|nr:hypothetical protein H920_03562 [Fukomys damarensis]